MMAASSGSIWRWESVAGRRARCRGTPRQSDADNPVGQSDTAIFRRSDDRAAPEVALHVRFRPLVAGYTNRPGRDRLGKTPAIRLRAYNWPMPALRQR